MPLERINVDVDIGSALSKVNQLDAAIKRLAGAKIQLQVGGDTDALTKLSRLATKLQDLQSKTINVGVTADTAAVEAAVNKVNGESVTVNLDADTSAAQAAVDKFDGEQLALNFDADTSAAQGAVDEFQGEQLTLNFDGDTSGAQASITELDGEQLTLDFDGDVTAAQAAVDAIQPPPPLKIDITPNVQQIAPPGAGDFTGSSSGSSFGALGAIGEGALGGLFRQGIGGGVGQGLAQGGAIGAGFAAATLAIKGASSAASEFQNILSGVVSSAADVDAGLREVASLQVPGFGLEQADATMRQFNDDLKLGVAANIPALYQALSAGVAPENALSFMEKTAKLARAGLADLQPTVLLVQSALLNYAQSGLTADDASNALFATITDGVVRLPQLAAHLGDVIPLASTLGVSFNDLNAAMATSTRQTLNVSRSTTSLRALLTELGSDTSKAGKAFEAAAGESFTTYIQQTDAAGNRTHNLSDAIQIMQGAADQTGTGIQNLFGNIRSGSAALSLAAQGGKLFSDTIADINKRVDEGGGVQRAFDINEESFKAKLSHIKAQIEGASIDLGKPIIEHIKPALDYISSTAIPAAIDFVKHLDFDSVKKNIGPAFHEFLEVGKDLVPVFEELGANGGVIQRSIDGLGVALHGTAEILGAFDSALDKLSTGLKDTAGFVAGFIDLLPDAALNMAGLGDKARDTAKSLHEFHDGIGNEFEQSKDESRAMAEAHTKAADAAAKLGKDSADMAAGVNTGANALDNMADAGGAAQSAVEKVDAAWNKFSHDVGLSQKEVFAGVQETLFKLKDDVKDLGAKSLVSANGEIDLTKEKGLKLHDAFDQVHGSIVQLTEDQANNKISAGEMVTGIERTREGFGKQLKAMGLSSKQIDLLKEQYGSFPTSVVTDLGFTFDSKGFITIQSAISNFDHESATAKLSYDLNKDGIVTGEELGTQFKGKVWDSKLGYVVDDATFQEALAKGENWANQRFVAKLEVQDKTGWALADSSTLRAQSATNARGNIFDTASFLPFVDRRTGAFQIGGEAGTEVLAPVNDMGRTIDLYRQAGALDRLVAALVSQGLAGPTGSSGQGISMAAGPTVAPVIHVNVPDGMNHTAFAREGIRQMRQAAAAATLDAWRSGRSRGGVNA